MNLIQKFHAILVSPEVRVWNYPRAKKYPRFVVWVTKEGPESPGYGYNSLEEMIEAAYAIIDPIKKPLPEKPPEPSSSINPENIPFASTNEA